MSSQWRCRSCPTNFPSCTPGISENRSDMSSRTELFGRIDGRNTPFSFSFWILACCLLVVLPLELSSASLLTPQKTSSCAVGMLMNASRSHALRGNGLHGRSAPNPETILLTTTHYMAQSAKGLGFPRGAWEPEQKFYDMAKNLSMSISERIK